NCFYNREGTAITLDRGIDHFFTIKIDQLNSEDVGFCFYEGGNDRLNRTEVITVIWDSYCALDLSSMFFYFTGGIC
ncbi:MAG: hypothetical protein C0616_05125, partial [Desulfuromonas sp.]